MGDRCLICGEPNTTNIRMKCKLCGMIAAKKILADGFIFCSNTCLSKFKEIYFSSDDAMRRILLKKDVVL